GRPQPLLVLGERRRGVPVTLALAAAPAVLAFVRSFLASPVRWSAPRALPRPNIAKRMPSAISEIVGGPPTNTGGPIGIAMTRLVGSTIERTGGLLARGGAPTPMSLQLNAGSAK